MNKNLALAKEAFAKVLNSQDVEIDVLGHKANVNPYKLEIEFTSELTQAVKALNEQTGFEHSKTLICTFFVDETAKADIMAMPFDLYHISVLGMAIITIIEAMEDESEPTAKAT